MARKILSAITLTVGITAAVSAVAGTDFSMSIPPLFGSAAIPLPSGKTTTYYDFVKSSLLKPMNGPVLPSSTNDDDLVKQGKGTSVKLNSGAYNFHVNYNSSPQSGRSYGWTQKSGGMVGDWSDKSYLQNLWTVVTRDDANELHDFYKSITQLVGSADSTGLSGLTDVTTERVAVNFLAIYTAEEYRALIPNGMRNWDDALFDVSLLAAFHAGQSQFALIYEGKFTDKTEVQAPGDFNDRGKPSVQGTPKSADISDYWQFTANPQKKNSGINETRIDFSAMGAKITQWELTHHPAMVKDLDSLVDGQGQNVFEDVTEFFAQGKAKASESDEIAEKVATLEVQIKADANDISKWISGGATASTSPDDSGDGTPTTPTKPHRPARTPARPVRPAAASSSASASPSIVVNHRGLRGVQDELK